MSRNDVLDSRGRPRVQTVNTLPDMTVQSDARDGDINVILAKYRKTGIIDSLRSADLIFKDVSEFTDLTSALQQAKVAEETFMKLPSKVREIFDHDVAVWLDTAHDKDKLEKLVELGMIETPVVEPVAAAVVATS